MGHSNITGLSHFGLYIKDMAVSKAFYTEHLGFAVTCQTQTDDGTRLCFLRNGDCEIELVQSANRPAPTVDGHFDHVSLRVRDIEQAVRDLKSAGIEPESDVRTLPGVHSGVKLVMFRGPDGEHLEFNQFL